MKVYFIDEKGEFDSLYQKVESSADFVVVVKNTKSFRATKNDFVVYAGLESCNSDTEALKKYSNLIVVATSKEEKTIDKLAFEYSAKDVIFSGCTEEYIAERICKDIKEFSEVIM